MISILTLPIVKNNDQGESTVENGITCIRQFKFLLIPYATMDTSEIENDLRQSTKEIHAP